MVLVLGRKKEGRDSEDEAMRVYYSTRTSHARLSQKNDVLQHQISQILDRRTRTSTASATSARIYNAAAGADR
jgi:hypothetical protein